LKNNKKKRLKIISKSWWFSLIVAILIATSFKSAIADWNDIPTGSLKPTILIGDRIIINKLAYDLKIPYTTLHLAQWANPKHGDIVVFYSPEDGKRLIKRVIGVPGDTVAMRRNRLFINGQPVNYNPLNQEIINQIEHKEQLSHVFFEENLHGKLHAVMLSQTRSSLTTFGPIKIPNGKYFMMGDNRDNSADSRFFGFVERKRIVGRAIKVGISRKGSFLNPRWHRFFKDLS
jgi:signal peptidase I